MADEVRAILSTGKALKLGEEVWPVVGDVVPPTFVDLIAEARHHNGIVYLSLAQTVFDMGATPEAVIATRLRMNLVTAQVLHSVLGNIIRDATKPAGKDKAN